MERIELDKVTPLLRAEHAHRYRWAASLARGRVLDAACGVGYGAPLLLQSTSVTSYTGVDVAQDALDIASRDFAAPGRQFVQGDVYSLPFPDGSFDTIVSLETIEHLDNPARALAEFKRVLAPDGLFLGSVPSKAFEEACRDAYGANEFHKSEFDDSALRTLIHGTFDHAVLWDCWLQISSVLQLRNGSHNTWSLDNQAPAMTRLGSVLFAAAQHGDVLRSINDLPTVVVYPATTVVEHERLTIRWRDRAIRNQEQLINERNELIRKMESRISSHTTAEAKLRDEIAALNGKYDERLKDYASAVARQTQMIDERVALIKKQDELVALRDATIAQQSHTISTLAHERDSLKQRLAAAEQNAIELRETVSAQINAHNATTAELSRITTLLEESRSLITHQAELLDKRTAFIKQLEAMIIERDLAIKNQTRLIQERDLAIKNQTKMIDDRDAAIKSQTAMIDARDGWIRNLRNEVSALKVDLERQKSWSGSLEVTLAERDLSLTHMESRLLHSESELEHTRTLYSHLEQDLERPMFCLKRTARAITKRVTTKQSETATVNGEASR